MEKINDNIKKTMQAVVDSSNEPLFLLISTSDGETYSCSNDAMVKMENKDETFIGCSIVLQSLLNVDYED